MRQKFHIDFVKNSKIFFCISLGIMLVALIVNIFVLPTRIDIQFTGGTIIKYSYSGKLTEKKISDVAQKATEDTITFSFAENLASSDSNSHLVSLQFMGNKAITVDEQDKVTEQFTKEFPDNNFKVEQSTVVDASKGANFFFKCLAAVIFAAILIIGYIGIRFKKIGGISAGVMAIVALVHDLIIVYFTFAMFNMSINDNFIAVVLMVLGYSVNDTIVIYDRIRENRRKMGPKATTAEVTNASINQCFTRTICTSITTLAAIGSVLVVSLIFNIESIISFALPMMIGLVSGCYSSICIAAPLWVMWKNHTDKKKAEKVKKEKDTKDQKKAEKKSKNASAKKNVNAAKKTEKNVRTETEAEVSEDETVEEAVSESEAETEESSDEAVQEENDTPVETADDSDESEE